MEAKTERTPGSWKFERVLRDCEHNKTIAAQCETRGLLYDFKIIHNGRHIGWWWQYSPNGGTDAKRFRYWLRDKFGESVQNGETYPKSHPVGSRNRAEFERVLESNIHRIPTDAELEARQL